MAGNLTTSGGTCVAVSAAAEHDINGSIAGAGGLYLGSGIYTINGMSPSATVPAAMSATARQRRHDRAERSGVTLVISGASTTCGSTSSASALAQGTVR